MSITSTRKVSSSYSAPLKGGYETAQGRQSFVETIDTTNSVLVGDDSSSEKQSYYASGNSDDETFEKQVSSSSRNMENGVRAGQVSTPLIDNDERDAEDSVVYHRHVNIYGANQTMSVGKDENAVNPYLKEFYEQNKIVEDIDELI